VPSLALDACRAIHAHGISRHWGRCVYCVSPLGVEMMKKMQMESIESNGMAFAGFLELRLGRKKT
jgi:hypothetical protein